MALRDGDPAGRVGRRLRRRGRLPAAGAPLALAAVLGVGVLSACEPAVDTDRDGIPDEVEIAVGFDSTDPDGDDDGLGDGDEDTDGDTVLDFVELALGSDPGAVDTDGDGLGDGDEMGQGSDPLDPDSPVPGGADRDGDGLSNGDEAAYGTDPDNPDTDADGYGDGEEVWNTWDPLDPQNPYSYLDNDGDEVYDLGSDPLDADSPTPGGADRDGDGLSNADEATYGTDPDDGDSDDDGYGDGDEVVNGWDPLDPSSPGA